MEKVIIVGSGPAGLTAAIYCARADLNPLVLAGYASGGQLMTTTDVENYPGFPEGIQGPELMIAMRKQAERFGARIIDTDVSRADLQQKPFRLTANDQNYETQSLIIATGARAKLMGLAQEKKLMGKGVSTCATCDGAFFRNEEICIIGGGDTAMEEATFLTRFAKKVYVIHRRSTLRASQAMQKRAFANPKIEFIWDSIITELLGDQKLTGIQVENLKTQEKKSLPVTGCFVAIGHEPTTELFKGQLDLDELGYIRVLDHTKTKIPGVFVAGDVFDHRYRQAITAAGMGCMAALDAQHFLTEH